jgi:chloramphenicol 3-O-phosphotransferase
LLALDEAAGLLGLSADAVRSVADSGFLAVAEGSNADPLFQLSDVKAFLARNADNGAGTGLLARAIATTTAAPAPPEDLEPHELLDLLDDRAEHMALRTLKIFASVFPEAGEWPPAKQGAFVRHAKGRFEAILAVTELGNDVDDAIYGELREIGVSAARSGTPLPQLLVIMRMSRDLVVQNAVEVAETDGRNGSFALSLLLTRILPAMDRLTDALAQGYWEASSGQS